MWLGQVIDGEKKVIARVVELAKQYFRKVPVLIITSGISQLNKMHAALRDDGAIPKDEARRSPRSAGA